MVTYKGNFGVLVLNISGNQCSGKYGADGVINGEFVDGKFTGKWNNKGLEGLIEFSIQEKKLRGSWKKGFEPGLMKGKWEGVEIDDTSSDSAIASNSSANIVTLINDFMMKVSDSGFDSFNSTDLKVLIETHLKHFNFFDEKSLAKIEEENTSFRLLIDEFPLRYLGLGLIYGELLHAVSEGECSININNDLLREVAYSLEDLKDREVGIAKAVYEDYGVTDFIPIFITKFIATLLIAFEETDDYLLLAELVLSCSTSEVDESLHSPWGDWISDMVIAIFDIHGYSPSNYVSDENISISGRYFMQAGIDSGYDYERLLENFRDSVI